MLCELKLIYLTSTTFITTSVLSRSVFIERPSRPYGIHCCFCFLFFHFWWSSWLHVCVTDSIEQTQLERHRKAQHTFTFIGSTHQCKLRHWSKEHRKERYDGVVHFLWICIVVVGKLIIVTVSHSYRHTDTNILMLDNFQVSSQL